MVTNNKFRQLALSLPETVELPHFEKTSFRRGKKIFATLSESQRQACVKLNEVDQSMFVSHDPAVIFPVPNKWGKQGWTLIDISKIKTELLKAILETSFQTVGQKPAKKSK